MPEKIIASTSQPPALTDKEVLDLCVKVLSDSMDLDSKGYCYGPEDIFRILVMASAKTSSIDGVCTMLRWALKSPSGLSLRIEDLEPFQEAPSPDTVRYHLQPLLALEGSLLEQKVNRALVPLLPAGIQENRHRVAIDLHFIPYYGQPAADPEEIRRGEAKAGTTRFHCWATAYVICLHKRVTVALTPFRASDHLLEVLQRLQELRIGIKRLYLDKNFATVEIIRFLKKQPFPAIIPLPRRGERLKKILKGRRSFRTTYTMTSREHGSVRFDLWVIFRYAKGKRGKHGVERLPYIVTRRLRCPIPRIREEHRSRFGVETSYDAMQQVRARTTSRNPLLRLLLVGIAFLLFNLWVYLKWARVSLPRRGGMTIMLINAVQAITDISLLLHYLHGQTVILLRSTESRKTLILAKGAI